MAHGSSGTRHHQTPAHFVKQAWPALMGALDWLALTDFNSILNEVIELSFGRVGDGTLDTAGHLCVAHAGPQPQRSAGADRPAGTHRPSGYRTTPRPGACDGHRSYPRASEGRDHRQG